MKGLCWLLVASVLVGAAGCTIGYRYHKLDAAIDNDAGASAEVDGGGHTFYVGTSFDFRYVRLVSSYLFPSYSFDIEDNFGGRDHHSSQIETRGMKLDAPLLSLWSDDGGIGYPGIMAHRRSVELWISGATRSDIAPSWWGDLSLAYYHYNVMALRAFGGWGALPIDRSTARIDEDGRHHEFWDTTAGGPTAGLEVTLPAGEYALDFFKFFIDAQDAASEPPR